MTRKMQLVRGRRWCKRAVSGSLMALVVAGGVGEAQAGEWEIKLDVKHSATSTSWNHQQQAMQTGPAHPAFWGGEPSYFSTWRTDAFSIFNVLAAEGAQGHRASLVTEITVTVHLRWKSSYSQEMPAKAAGLLIGQAGNVQLEPKAGSTYQIDNGAPGLVLAQDYQSYSGHSSVRHYKSGQVRVSLANPQQAENLTFGPIKLVTNGSAIAPVEDGEDQGSLVIVNAQLSVEPHPRTLAISSSIDQSYYKSTQPPPPALDANGQPQPTPTPVVGTNPPAWRVPVPPGQQVHSAAGLMTLANSADRYWFGSAAYTANTMGFFSPTYAWTFSPGAKSADGSPSIDPFNQFDASALQLLAPAANSSAFPISSSAQVTVTDTQGSMDDFYSVLWHLPNENWQKKNELPHPKLIFTKAGYAIDNNQNVKSTVEPNHVLTFDIPSQRFEFNWKKGIQEGQVLLNVGSAGVGVWAAVAGSAASLPAAAVTVALTGTAGIIDLIAGEEPAPIPESRDASYAQYKADMLLQKQVNDARATDPTAFPDQMSRCDDTGFVNSAVAEIERLVLLYPSDPNGPPDPNDHSGTDGHWAEDKYFGQVDGQLRCSGQAGRGRHKEVWKGDEYGANGYEGVADIDIIRQHTVFYVLNWSFVFNGPPGAHSLAISP